MNEQTCRRIVQERAEHRCERCDRWTALTLHHRKKRSQGGAWSPTNCVMLCGHGTTGCHGFVEDHPNKAEALGWHIRPWHDPATRMVLYRGCSWAYLTEDGKVEYETDPRDTTANLESGSVRRPGEAAEVPA